MELEWIYWKRAEHYRIPAHVVRADENGLGLEWCEFAPPGWVAVLMSTHSPTNCGVLQAQRCLSGADERNLVDAQAQNSDVALGPEPCSPKSFSCA